VHRPQQNNNIFHASRQNQRRAPPLPPPTCCPNERPPRPRRGGHSTTPSLTPLHIIFPIFPSHLSPTSPPSSLPPPPPLLPPPGPILTPLTSARHSHAPSQHQVTAPQCPHPKVPNCCSIIMNANLVVIRLFCRGGMCISVVTRRCAPARFVLQCGLRSERGGRR
jgi:hypothetical protein